MQGKKVYFIIWYSKAINIKGRTKPIAWLLLKLLGGGPQESFACWCGVQVGYQSNFQNMSDFFVLLRVLECDILSIDG